MTVFQLVLVRMTLAKACEMAAEKAKRVAVENCILTVLCEVFVDVSEIEVVWIVKAAVTVLRLSSGQFFAQ